MNNILNTHASNTHVVAFPFVHFEILDKIDKCELYEVLEDKSNVKFVDMTTSGCHNNCDLLLENDDTIKIFTGYALSLDGLWRYHSWCIDKDDSIIETTESRILYFGAQVNV